MNAKQSKGRGSDLNFRGDDFDDFEGKQRHLGEKRKAAHRRDDDKRARAEAREDRFYSM